MAEGTPEEEQDSERITKTYTWFKNVPPQLRSCGRVHGHNVEFEVVGEDKSTEYAVTTHESVFDKISDGSEDDDNQGEATISVPNELVSGVIDSLEEQLFEVEYDQEADVHRVVGHNG